MNTLDTLSDWLLATTLRASALAVIILGIQAMLRSRLPASWRHSLWFPMLLVLVLPVLPAVPFGLFPQAQPEIPALSVEASPVVNASAPTMEPAIILAKESPKLSGKGLLTILWLAGVVAMLAAGMASYRRNLRQFAKGAVSPDESLLRSVESAAREVGLRRAPAVLVSTAVESPAVTGFVQPLLLLPAGFPDDFSKTEERLILLHEFSHLKRLDLPVNWLSFVLQSLHWFNPILWFAFTRMRADREEACDARVLSINAVDCRSDYGNALIKLQGKVPWQGLSLGFVGIFQRGADLRSRIRGISRHGSGHAAWHAVGASAIVLLTLFGATRAAEPAKPDPKPTANEGKKLDPRQVEIEKKLDAIVIPVVNFEDTSIEEAIDFLRQRSVELDKGQPATNKKGVNFVIRRPRGVAGKPVPVGGKIASLKLKNVTLRQALTHVAESTRTRFLVDPFAITFTPADEVDDPAEAPAPEKPKPSGKAIEAASSIIIPVIDFENTSLTEAVKFLNLRAKELAGDKPVFPIALDPKANGEARITELRLRNVPLSEAVNYCVEKTRHVYTGSDTEITIKRPW